MNCKFHILLPFLLSLLIVGCTSDDRRDCNVETSLELRFEYDAGQDTSFTEVITAVDVILFDGNGIYMGHYRMDKEVLNSQRNVRTTIDPGNYYAISWANVNENAVFNDFVPGVTTLEECMLEIPNYSTETGDPLYYAVYRKNPETRNDTKVLNEINVPPGQSVIAEMGFVRAHRTINVWIQGYCDVKQPGLAPTAIANNLWTQYSFFFTTRSHKRTFTQVAQACEINGEIYTAATFHSALGAIEEDMQIVVCRTSDGAVSCLVNLRQFVEENKITPTEEINMLLKFYDLGVTVTLPTWEEKPVSPGIE